MIKAMKSAVKESEGDIKSSHLGMSAAASVNGSLLYNQHPFSQLCWPRTIQSPIQSQEQQENPMNETAQKMQPYLVPCPWFFLVPDQRNGFLPHRSADTNNIQFTYYDKDQCSGPPSRVDVVSDNNTSLSIKAKPEPANLEVIRVIDDLNEMPVECTMDEASCYLKKQPASGVTSGFAVKKETDYESDHYPITDGIYEKASKPIRTGEQRINNPSHKYISKTAVDAASAAAAARRRRKELTKLKNLHSRQCRMKC